MFFFDVHLVQLREILEEESFFGDIGFDTAESGPSNVCQRVAPSSHRARRDRRGQSASELPKEALLGNGSADPAAQLEHDVAVAALTGGWLDQGEHEVALLL